LAGEVLYDWMVYLLPSIWEEKSDVNVKKVPVVVREQTSRPDYGHLASGGHFSDSILERLDFLDRLDYLTAFQVLSGLYSVK
jgi:hypothetical protein